MSTINDTVMSIIGLCKRLADLSQLADGLASQSARLAIERNHDFFELCRRGADGDVACLRGYVSGRGEFYAEADFEIKDAARAIESQALDLCGELHVTVEPISKFSAAAKAMVDGAMREKAAAESRVAQMMERLKEHALNDAVVREKVWSITDGKCFYCEVELMRGADAGIGHPRLFHVDHLVPRSLGGPDHLANYVPACGSCNSSKHARHFAEFVMSRKAKQEQPLLQVIEGGAA
jgi:hypothetical protein